MYLKKLPDKFFFDKNGYVILDTNLIKNHNFNQLTEQFEIAVQNELNNNNLKKLGGFIMGNFGINQGPLGQKLYALIFNSEFINYFEQITEKKFKSFKLNYGGNLVLPKKGNQHFHTDGSFNDEMYLISIATENITLKNGPTEIIVGSNNFEMTIDQFFFTKKKKLKLLINKGQILIRKHNLWHRGTTNNSEKPRLLLSFVMIPKYRKIELEKITSKLEILPNFFKNDFRGKLHEFIYVKFGILIILVKVIMSFFKRLFKKNIKFD